MWLLVHAWPLPSRTLGQLRKTKTKEVGDGGGWGGGEGATRSKINQLLCQNHYGGGGKGGVAGVGGGGGGNINLSPISITLR